MPQDVAEIVAHLEAATRAGYRGNILAKGLARGLIWRDGELPDDAPDFSSELSTDLLDHGFLILSNALRLREIQRDHPLLSLTLQVAAESLESAARHDNPRTVDRGFHLVMAAAAFHIGGYAARAYSLFRGELSAFNLASYELGLVHLMRRDLEALRDTVESWLTNPANSDAGVTARLANDDEFTVDDALATALTGAFHRAIGTFEVGLLTGREQYFAGSQEQLLEGERAAATINHVPLWWAFRIARHLFDDLWRRTLRQLLPSNVGPKLWPVLRERFVQMVATRSIAEIDLWPSQIEAASRVADTTDNLVVALPTSAGKTRIAELCILRTLADERRIIYVTPLRALSAQIEFGLARTFRPLGFAVTSVYGASGVAQSDLDTIKSANIVVATPEKLDFAIRQEPTVLDDVGLIVLDEGHMIGLGERELHYEMLVQRILRRSDAATRRLVCLSAVFTDGDAFDDFTSWMRSDRPGKPVRSTWRPTRQRPGRLRWTGRTGRLEFDVDDERPYVQRFVEKRVPTGLRKKAFPKDKPEFLVAATASFLSRGQSVLVYCPRKDSVESTARAFLEANRQGYFSSPLDSLQRKKLSDATRVGMEWLGPSHPAVRCLELGIAVHHGSLPRPFLGEIETMLRSRTLPVCICSPTLAQGLDLSFSVLLFQSLYRVRDNPIPPQEFANVVGRIGRAFVDLDGLYVLPVFETNTHTENKRLSQFRQLINRAQNRQLESGVRLLVGNIIQALQSRLGGDPRTLKEYVLNTASTWEVAPQDGDNWQEWMKVALNELDIAILSIVDALDVPTSELADYLDKCLKSSYWQRRLRREEPELRDLHTQVVKGRAKWLWAHTTLQRRRACFSAGVGFEAGRTINESLDRIGELLATAEDALDRRDLTVATANTVALAEILYAIGPFQPDGGCMDGWEILIGHWLRGTALSTCTDNDGIAFIQDNIVFRLVWAVEAARLHLQHVQELGIEAEPPGGTLALCLTYGVPSYTCALFMQAGLASRTMATSIASKIGIDLSDMDMLRSWVKMLRNNTIPPVKWTSESEEAEWARFLHRFDHRDIRKWREVSATMHVQWNAAPPEPNRRVRVIRIGEGPRPEFPAYLLDRLVETTIPDSIRSDYFTALVAHDQATITTTFFGPAGPQ